MQEHGLQLLQESSTLSAIPQELLLCLLAGANTHVNAIVTVP